MNKPETSNSAEARVPLEPRVGYWYWTNSECLAYVAAEAPEGLDTPFVFVGWIDYGNGDVQAAEWTERGSSTLYDPPGGDSLVALIQ